jgi:hypothetical protein
MLKKFICFILGHTFFEFNPDKNYKACKRCGWVKIGGRVVEDE